MKGTNIDYVSPQGIQGELAAHPGLVTNQRLDVGQMRPYVALDKNGVLRSWVTTYNGGDPKKVESFRTTPINTNATLRRDEWKQLDEALLMISETRLGGVQDLVDRGLVYTLGNAMGTTVLEYHDVSDALEADLTMDAVTRATGDRPDYQTVYLPIPIIHADYELNARALAASRNLGNPLDTTLAERAARKVSLKLEQMLFTNTTYAFGGGVIYSYVNHPDRNLITLSNYGNWDDSAVEPSRVMECVKDMKQASIDAKHYGPWMLYIPTNYETALDGDYYTAGPTRNASAVTVRQRILNIDGILGVKVVDTLPSDTVLLVQMSTDVVRLVRGMGLQNIEWTTEGGMVHKYKVMTIQVPQVRSDQNGASGIVHAS